MKRTEPNIETLKTLLKLKNEGSTVQEICEKLNISKSTYHGLIKRIGSETMGREASNSDVAMPAIDFRKLLGCG